VRVAPLLERLRADAAALSGGLHAVSLEGSPRVICWARKASSPARSGNLISNALNIGQK